MSFSKEQFEDLLSARENEHVEFKEAKNQFDYEELLEYCVAFANERGGWLVLGVTNRLPRKVVGSTAFKNLQKLKTDIYIALKIRLDIDELFYEGKRVVVFSIPSRPMGRPLHRKGKYMMRVVDRLEPMTPEQLETIFAESQPDFSAEQCVGATLDDLDPIAIETFRKQWHKKSRNDELLNLSIERLLIDAELFDGNRFNYAALILLGKRESLGRLLANAEIVYEFRLEESAIQHDAREEFRNGFLAIQDKLWETINKRNGVQHIQDGLFVRDIQNFNEEVVRESLLNAVCHRDYRLGSSVFIRHSPKLLVIENPGGFPAGVTAENILTKQNPRNRRIAEVFQKCGLVERSGQGVDKMFRRTIEEAKERPDYSRSDEFNVVLWLRAEVQDPQFLQFFEQVSTERKINWSLRDLVLLDDIRRNKSISPDAHPDIERLKNEGVIEIVGRGRGTRYILSKKFYTFVGERGVYTRSIGLDSEEKKALILKHLKEHGKGIYSDFGQLFPTLNRNQIARLLKLLRKGNKIRHIGTRKSGHWELV
ncbi:MAG: RNA-binding domain-containing protein [bacterium]